MLDYIQTTQTNPVRQRRRPNSCCLKSHVLFLHTSRKPNIGDLPNDGRILVPFHAVGDADAEQTPRVDRMSDFLFAASFLVYVDGVGSVV